jgi:hypothetical protein
MDGVNNFARKQVLCRDNALAKNFRVENINDVENMVIELKTYVVKN